MTSKLTEVLLVTPFFSPNIGGVESRLRQIICDSRNFFVGYTVITFCPLANPSIEYQIFERIKDNFVFRCPWFRGNLFSRFESSYIFCFFYLTLPLAFFTLIYLLFKGRRIQTIHAAGLNAAAACVFWSKIFRKRFVVSTHAFISADQSKLKRYILRVVLGNADVVLAIGQTARVELEQGLGLSNVELQPSWLNFDDFDKSGVCLPREFQVERAKKKFWLGFIGRLEAYKGIRELVDFFVSEEDEAASDWGLVIGGTGTLGEDIKREASKTRNIVFLGSLEHELCLKVISSCDAIGVLSLYEEGFSRTAMEAVCLGVPVLSSQRGCLAEIVEENVSGLSLPKNMPIKIFLGSALDIIARKKIALGGHHCAQHNREKFGKEPARIFYASLGVG